MATTDSDIEKFYDNAYLDDLEKADLIDNREQCAKELASEMQRSLPDDFNMRGEALTARYERIDRLRIFNQRIEKFGEKIETVNLSDVPLEDRRFLLYPFLPEDEVTFCTGQGGVGKSYLFLQIACLLAAGFTDAEIESRELSQMTVYHYFLQPKIADLNWQQTQPVVYASYEDNHKEMRRRIQTVFNTFEWTHDKQDTIFDNFHPISMRQHGPLWAPEHGKHIQTRSKALPATNIVRKECECHKAKLLIIDPVSAAFYGDENSKAEVYAFINDWASWGEREKTAVLISGHLPKNRGESRRAGYSGASAWEGAVRSLFTLDKFDLNEDEDGERKKDKDETGRVVTLPRKWYLALKGIKGNYAPTAKEEIPVIRGDYGWLEHTGEVKLSEARSKAHQVLEGHSSKQSPSSTTQEDTHDEQEFDEADIPEF